MGTDRARGRRWGDDEQGVYIRLLPTGQKFHLADPRPEEFNLACIANHLAGINRYTGGSRYTVGQHCVVASRMAARFYSDHALLPARMLIHDIAEFAYGDVSSPLKAILGDYRELEQKAELAIEQWCDLTFVGDELVKQIDTRMWLTERLTVFPMLTQEDDYAGDLLPFELTLDELNDEFQPWAPEVVEHEFRIAFAQLLPWMKQ